jgi:hypothetical protein
MKKTIKHLVAGLTLSALVVISGLVTIIFFPHSLFANEMEHNKFRVYSDYTLSQNHVKPVLDQAYELASRCELHDPDYQFDLFLADQNIFNAIESLQGEGPIARATAGNIIVKIPVDFKNNQAIGRRSKVNLAELLTHEMVHILQANTYGLLNFSPLQHPPLWKLEGYPEYVSRQNMLKAKDYSLAVEINRYVELEHRSTDGFVEVVKGHHVPAYYYKGRIMIEYLIDIEGMTYDEILNDSRTEDEVFKQVLDWTMAEKIQ